MLLPAHHYILQLEGPFRAWEFTFCQNTRPEFFCPLTPVHRLATWKMSVGKHMFGAVRCAYIVGCRTAHAYMCCAASYYAARLIGSSRARDPNFRVEKCIFELFSLYFHFLLKGLYARKYFMWNLFSNIVCSYTMVDFMLVKDWEVCGTIWAIGTFGFLAQNLPGTKASFQIPPCPRQ